MIIQYCPLNQLINKLKRYGIKNKTHAWISTHVKCGVPQGTILGPLLFLVYINDLPDNIHSTVRLLVDNCVLYREINNQIDSQKLLKDLDELTKSEHDW